MKKIFISIIAILAFVNVNAQFKVSAEFRPRFEFRSGYKDVMLDSLYPAYFVSQRSRINFDIVKEQYEARLSVQDVRVWGDEAAGTSIGSIGIYEAWFKLYFLQNFSLKAGRQTLIYDDENLLSNSNWGQKALKHDALLLGYKKDNFLGDFAFSLNNTSEKSVGSEYPTTYPKMMSFLYLKKTVNDNFYISAIALANAYQKDKSPNTIYVTGTYGAYSVYDSKKLLLKFYGYYQNGSNVKGKKVSAFLLTGEAGIKTPKLEFSVGAEYVSGNNVFNTNADYQAVEHNFELVYNSKHKFNGYIDYFTNIPKATSFAGLIDIYPRIVLNINDKAKFSTDYHYFMQANPIADALDPTKEANKFLAHEVDFVFDYKFNKSTALQIGYLFILPSETMLSIKKIDTGMEKFSQFAYVMLTFKPEFFNSENK